MAAVPHVVVITFPFASHAVKLFRLARALAAAAPAATFSFLSTAGSIAQLQEKNHDALEANLRFVEVPDGLVPPASSGGAGTTPPPNHMARLGLFLAAAEAGGVGVALETARANAGGARVTCVVGDAFVWMAAEAAAAVGAPWVPVWTGGPSALLAHLQGDALRDDIGDKAASRADELLTSHPGLGSYRVRDLPDGCVFGEMHLPIVALFRRVADQLHVPRAATAVALNTFPGLLPDDVTAALAAELPEVLPIGPFHLLPVPGDDSATAADPHGCLAWLDSHPARAVAYASFGTVVTAVVGGQEELRELAAGLEASGAPFLWSLPKEYWPLLPPGFLELDRAKVVPWAPQAAVLRHASVGGFVTHAGWASVLEGVAAGVPMACRPFFSDQRMNARMVSHVWGFGTVFEQPMTRGTVAAAVSSMLLAGDQQGLTRMQEMRSMAATAFLLPDGGSRKNLDKLLKIVCPPSQDQNRDDHVDEAEAEVTRCARTATHDHLLGASSLAHTVAE